MHVRHADWADLLIRPRCIHSYPQISELSQYTVINVNCML